MTNPNHRILIVDDEENLRRTLGMILGRAGFSVETANGGHQALEMLKSEAFDLLFLDLRMPDMDGETLLPVLRKTYPAMPVMILTAHATLESAIAAVRQGAYDYFIKPVDPQEIIDRTRAVLDEHNNLDRRRKIVDEIKSLITELKDIHGQAAHAVEAEDPGEDTNFYEPRDRFIRKGAFLLDIHTRTVHIGKRSIPLPPTTFDYLVTLAHSAPDPVPYAVLVKKSQGFEVNAIEARDMARWRIHELRKAIEPDTRTPQYIITVRNIGYRLIA